MAWFPKLLNNHITTVFSKVYKVIAVREGEKTLILSYSLPHKRESAENATVSVSTDNHAGTLPSTVFFLNELRKNSPLRLFLKGRGCEPRR